MRIQIVLIFLFVLILQLQAYEIKAQRLIINANKTSLGDVLKQFKEQTSYDFLYNPELVAHRGLPVTIEREVFELEEALSKIFQNQPNLSYVIDQKTVIIRPKKENIINIIKQLFDVKGKINNEKGEPLPGAAIKVKGETKATLADSNGEFILKSVDIDAAVLVISYTGYQTEEIALKGRTNISVQLIEDMMSLNETIVIGYGTQKKRDLTGAVSSIKAEDLVISSGPEIGNMLKGKVAGLTIRQNSAQPGGGLDILVRGAGSVNASNDPLIVVDGFPISDLQQPSSGGRYQAGTQSILNSFNPNDIESIEVLKDASSTSIYGSRAANGVILITTKKGIEGATKVEYSNQFSFQKYNNAFDVLPLDEWMQVRNEAGYEQWMFDNNVYPFGTKTLEEAQANPVNGLYRKLYTQNAINNVGRGTDWLDLVMRDGSGLQHNVSVTGGNTNTKYLISGNYYDQNGIVKNADFKRYSLRANIDQNLNKFLKLGVNLSLSRIDNNNTQLGSVLGSDDYENSGIIRAAMQQGPHIQAIDENGNYPLNPQLSLQPNPYSLLTITDKGRIERMLLNTFLDITPIDGLLVKLKAGMDRGYTQRNNYIPITTLHGSLEKGRAYKATSDRDDYLLEATANYTKVIDTKHKFDFLLGASQQKTSNQMLDATATGFITDAFLWNNIGSGSTILPSNSIPSPSNVFASYFGRINYNYEGKYLATFTVRKDGAGVFSENNKWGTFPSGALAWNIAEEGFIKNITNIDNVISQLKVRVSYGKTGNATISSNAFASYSAYPAWLSESENRLIGVSLTRLANPDLKWETTTEKNLGLDFSFFKGKVEGSVELYDKQISDLLAVKPINSYHEINTIIANVGKTQSKGFEITINTRNVKTKNFQWKTGFALSRYKDNWLERAEDWKPSVYESTSDPIRSMYYRISDGILQTGEAPPISQPELKPGMIKVKDINGYVRDEFGNPVVDANGRFLRTGEADGIIDEADTKLLGTSDPKFMIGFTNILTYKNFSLNIDFNGLLGRSISDPNFTTYGISAYGVYANGYNALKTVKDRWTPTNPSTTQPSSFWGFSPYTVGDFFLQDAWFIRLQNVSLGYTLPKNFTKGVFSSAKINVNAHNLFVISPYTGIDPETDSYTAAYPNIRSFSAGLSFTF